MGLFDARSRTALQRARIRTWGDLSHLSDVSLGALPGVGELTVGRVNAVLAAQGRLRGSEVRPHRTGREDVGPRLQFRPFGMRYPWLDSQPSELVPMELFDARSRTTLERAGVRTWGDLAQLSDMSLRAIPAAGELTVGRVNEVLAGLACAVSAVEPQPTDEGDAPRPLQTHLETMAAAVEWAVVVADVTTLGGLFDACNGSWMVPDEVAVEVKRFLDTHLPTSSTSLPSVLERLLMEARDRDLLVARKCVREPPTLETLARGLGVTRERVRQKVARDEERVRACVNADHRYRSIKWAVAQFRVDLGAIAHVESEIVDRWIDRCESQNFDVLRWVAGYTYDGEWLLNGKDSLADLKTRLDGATGEEWLLSRRALLERVSGVADEDTAHRLLIDSGCWRDIGDGWLVRWDGPIQAKAERVLRLTCTPMTPDELIEAIGHGSEAAIKNQRGDRLIRVDKHFRLGLPEWGLEEYEGIVTEIRQRIERGGGVASISAIIDEFTRVFGVSVSSIESYLSLPMFTVSADSVRLGDDTHFKPRSPARVSGAVEAAVGWGERHLVTESILRGYSFSLSPHLAWANGLRPGDDLLAPVNGSSAYKASVIWRTTSTTGRVDVGRVREWLVDHSVAVGTEVLICPTPTDVTIFVGHGQIEEARRAHEASAPAIAPDIASLMEEL